MIAREAYRYLVISVFIAVFLQYQFSWYAIPAWLLVLLLAYLFRNEKPILNSDPLALLSPVSSVVKSISTTHDPYTKRNARSIEFDMGVFDPYLLRSVTEGKIMNFWMRHPDAACQEQIRAAWIQTDEGDDVVMEIHPSRSQQIMCYYATGERVGQGKKCGFLPFGSKIVIYLPEDSSIDVKVGDRVSAGKDIIAHWGRS